MERPMPQITLTFGHLFDYLEATPNSRNITEGEQVANAGHVITLGTLGSRSARIIKIFALCLKTSALTDKPHEITGELEINYNCVKICHMKCSCKAGLSGKCKHIAGVLILCTRQSINNLDQLSSTDVKNYWTRKVYSQKYSQVPLCQYKCTMSQEVSSLNREESKWVVDFLADQLPLSNLGKQIKGRENIFESDEIDTEDEGDEYKSVINHCKHSPLIEMLDIITPEKKCCQELINSLKCDALKLTVKTKNDEEIWMKERQFRITASRCYNIYTYNGSDWPKKAITYFWPKSFTNKYVKHGRKFEDAAREAYITSNGVRVVQLGLVICEKQPWLACTPDGVIVDDDGNPRELLEIKCPYVGTTLAAEDFIENCSYLTIENNTLALKRKHLYYNQVQLSLAILDLNLCRFILYSSSSGTFIQINIERDNEYCINLLHKLQNNYFHCMMHNVCEELNKNI